MKTIRPCVFPELEEGTENLLSVRARRNKDKLFNQEVEFTFANMVIFSGSTFTPGGWLHLTEEE